MANMKQDVLDQKVTIKWTDMANDVIKAANHRHRSIVFVRTKLLNQYWVLLTIVYNPKTDGKLREIDKRVPINEFLGSDSNKLALTICSVFEQSMGT